MSRPERDDAADIGFREEVGERKHAYTEEEGVRGNTPARKIKKGGEVRAAN